VIPSSFQDELAKIAGAPGSVVAPPTTSFKDFKKKLRPGDIVLAKRVEPAIKSDIVNIFQRIRNKNSPLSDWTHAGLYIGDGKIRHSYTPYKGMSKAVGESGYQVRDQDMDFLREKRNAEFMAFRPKLPAKERQQAVKRSEEYRGLAYATMDAIRAGVLPAKRKDEEKAPGKLICTAVPAFAYSDEELVPGKSRRHILPIDFALSKKLKPVATLEKEGSIPPSFFDELAEISAAASR